MRAWLALVPALLLLCPVGCQRLPGGEEDDDGPAPSESTDGGTFLSGDNSQDDNADGETEADAVCDPVGQIGCGTGEKCTIIISGGSPVFACVSDPGGLGPNDPCQASPADGVDGCPASYVCVQDESGNGLCASLCEDSSHCTQGECIPSREDEIPYCADDCSPFDSPCPPPLQCRRNGNRFSCQFLSESDVGASGSACSVADDAGCAPGLVCIPGALVPDCTTDNCCTPVCDTSESNPCAAPSTCNDLLQGPAPGFENIGACFVPA